MVDHLHSLGIVCIDSRRRTVNLMPIQLLASMMSMVYLPFVENRVPITILILANQVAHLPALVETGPRPTSM